MTEGDDAIGEVDYQRLDDEASARAQAALARDQAAQARDVAASARDRRAASGEPATGRQRASVGAADRAAAAADRDAAAADREQAARDRIAAHDAYRALRRQLLRAETDELTGARTRAAGLLDLAREIDRAHRTHDGSLVAVYVDLVGLKRVNDTRGHAAGDALLRGAVARIRDHLRTYDVIVRLGGDEFLCAMPNATPEEARDRFRDIQTGLAADPHPSQIKYGIAALAPGDDVAGLVERADANLPVSPPR